MKYRNTDNDNKHSNNNNYIDNCNQTANPLAIFYFHHYSFYCLIFIIKLCMTLTIRVKFYALNLSYLPSNFMPSVTLFMSTYLLIIMHPKVSKWLGKLKENNILLDFPEFVSQYTVRTVITYTV